MVRFSKNTFFLQFQNRRAKWRKREKALGHENPAAVGPPGSYVPHALAGLTPSDHMHQVSHVGQPHPMFATAAIQPPQFRTDLSALAMAAAVAAGQAPFMTAPACPPPPGLAQTAGELVWPPGMMHPGLQSLIYFNQAAAAAAMANANPLMNPTLAWPTPMLMKSSPPAAATSNPPASGSPKLTPGPSSTANTSGQQDSSNAGNCMLSSTPNSSAGGPSGHPTSECGSPVSNASSCTAAAMDPRRKSIDALRMKAKEHAAALCEKAMKKQDDTSSTLITSSSASNSPSNTNCGKCIEGF